MKVYIVVFSSVGTPKSWLTPSHSAGGGGESGHFGCCFAGTNSGIPVIPAAGSLCYDRQMRGWVGTALSVMLCQHLLEGWVVSQVIVSRLEFEQWDSEIARPAE